MVLVVQLLNAFPPPSDSGRIHEREPAGLLMVCAKRIDRWEYGVHAWGGVTSERLFFVFCFFNLPEDMEKMKSVR